MSDPRRLRGRAAERLVAAWLTGSGWTLLAQNWRTPEGELDLICRDPLGTLVGVEVKCRTSGHAGSALESVDPRRIGRLRRTLARYAATTHGDPRCGLRIDLVTVTPARENDWRLLRIDGIDAW